MKNGALRCVTACWSVGFVWQKGNDPRRLRLIARPFVRITFNFESPLADV